MAFKLLVFAIGMFFAIKWHHDQAQKERKKDTRELLLACGKVAPIFVASLVSLGLFTFALARAVGLDLMLP